MPAPKQSVAKVMAASARGRLAAPLQQQRGKKTAGNDVRMPPSRTRRGISCQFAATKALTLAASINAPSMAKMPGSRDVASSLNRALRMDCAVSPEITPAGDPFDQVRLEVLPIAAFEHSLSSFSLRGATPATSGAEHGTPV